MHHVTPFWDEKFINFLGRGTALPRLQPLAAYGASILASSALDPRPPNVPVALTPMSQYWQQKCAIQLAHCSFPGLAIYPPHRERKCVENYFK